MEARSKTVLLGTAFLLTSLVVGCKQPPAKTTGEGSPLRAFILKNVESGERYCQVCRNKGRPTLLMVMDLQDPGVEQDLTAIQGLVDKHGAAGFRAFVVFGEIDGGTFKPVASDDEATALLKATKEKLKLSYPVAIVPSSYTDEEKKGFVPFVDSYDIKDSRTVLFADIEQKVIYRDVLKGDPAQYQRLSETIEKTL